MWVKHLNRLFALGLSLNNPDDMDYFTLPNNLYKNLQKCTSAINSLEMNFLSSFDIVSTVVGVSWTVYWFFA